MNRSTFAVGILFASFLASPGVARADAIAPDEASCTGKAAGDACVTEGADGHCAAKKCSRLDYSDGSPPGTKVVDCLVCVTGGVADAASPADAATNGTDGGSSAANDGGASPASSGSSSSSSCALAGVPGLRTVGPWLLGALPLLVLRKQRRKASR